MNTHMPHPASTLVVIGHLVTWQETGKGLCARRGKGGGRGEARDGDFVTPCPGRWAADDVAGYDGDGLGEMLGECCADWTTH